ncbi:hypothetical protein KSP39_PZI020888 [Platanthera zijinensis]|uniref:Integrase catalytic domain-containing protein n=1 Tax=Platanthera zijinensis TaxID=2320716 RepID=A0AAP0B0S9_9ASPA
MKVALLSKNKVCFTDGSITPPSHTDTLYSPWERCNTMVLSWIHKSISDTILQSVLWIDNAFEVWSDLKDRFSQGDIFPISDLQEDIFRLRQGDSTVSEYFTKLKGLWDELEMFNPVPTCTCSIPCSCGVVQKIRKYRDQDYLIRFLKGLTEQYATVRSQIMLLDPLPTVNKAFSLVTQQERQFHSIIPSSTDVQTFNTTGVLPTHPSANWAQKNFNKGKGRGNKNQISNAGKGNSTNRLCTHCGKTNHTIDSCFYLHGFPPGYKTKTDKSINTITSGQNLPSTVTSQPSTDFNKSFTREQYEGILTLLHQQLPSSSTPNSSLAHAAILNTDSMTQGRFGSHWLIDTGATDHITYNLKNFTSYHNITPIPITMPNGTHTLANISGTVHLSSSLILFDVLYVPSFTVNLISVTKLTSNLNCFLVFHNNSCSITQMPTNRMIGIAKQQAGLFILAPLQIPSTTCQAQANMQHVSPVIWHNRFGHLSHSTFKTLSEQFPCISSSYISPCDVCHYARQKRLPYISSTSSSNKIFDLLHVDIWGSYSTSSVHDHKYFLTMVDDFSRFTWLILMKSKGEARQHLKNFIHFIDTQFSTKLKTIRTDNGLEFSMNDFYQSKGILHQTTCVETPQQNGIVERKHQHIMNVARALFFQAKIPSQLWCYAVTHSTHIINRLPSPLLKQKTPYELLYKTPPSFVNLKVFGCLAYASTLMVQRTKFSSRARKTIFLGYKGGTKGYLLYDLHSKEIFLSRNVTFYEDVFPLHSSNQDSIKHSSSSIPQPCFLSNEPVLPLITNSEPPNTATTSDHNNTSEPPDTTFSSSPISNSLPVRHSSRTHHKPHYLQDYHCSLSTKSHNSHIEQTTPTYSLSSVLTYDHCSPHYRNFCLNISSFSDPNTYAQASKHECWNKAMKKELLALEYNNTWDIVTLPPGKKPVGCKWVYKTKLKADGSLERHKARLVAKGFNQMEGVDYFDTYSPVAKITTIRVLLTIAAAKGWFLEQLDVNNAFLHGDLHEEVYMSLPPGSSSTLSNPVCKLKKSIYGLKQASKQWYSKLSTALYSLGYKQSTSDHSLFIKTEGSAFTTILVYVDDIVLAGNCTSEFLSVKKYLHKQFQIKDLGPLRFFLGLEISRSKDGIIINQRKYALELLSDCGFLASKPASTPMDPSLKLRADQGSPFPDPSSFRRLIGRLLYLTTTHPDICFAVQQLSQFVSKPMDTHYIAATRILRYIKQAPGTGLFFPSNSDLKTCGFADSDWACCLDSRRSITGYCLFIGPSLVSWKVKKQPTVSRSSCEAEYRALASLTCEIQWLHYLLTDLKVFSSTPTNVYCDSKSAIYLAHNPSFHERTKHIDLDCHVIREKIEKGLIHLLPVPSSAQLADFFTKALHPSYFKPFLSKFGLQNIYSPT